MKKNLSGQLFSGLSQIHMEYLISFHKPSLKKGFFELDKTNAVDSLYTKCENMLDRYSSQLYIEGFESCFFRVYFDIELG